MADQTSMATGAGDGDAGRFRARVLSFDVEARPITDPVAEPVTFNPASAKA